MGEMFELLKEGLEEILEYKKGKKELQKRVVEIPDPVIQYTAEDVKRIRKSLDYSMRFFTMTKEEIIRELEEFAIGKK